MKAVLGDYELPSFPVIILNALEKVRDADESAAEISELVATDPGLSVRVLTTVNSAAYALKHKVNNIDHAVSLMGRGELESILISMAVHEVIPTESIPGFDAHRFWGTAARRAALARGLADLIDPSSRSESFTAALLQDMAVPILARQRADDYGPVLEHWYSNGSDLATLERETFDWDHATVAMWMCDDWGFPERITEAIGAHHGTNDDLVALPAVSLVGVLREQGESTGVEQLVESAYENYGLSRDQVVELVETSFAAAEDIARMFS
ncbi:MAG: HDOD domain-containing protein [Gammaproteobacteria bacterium]